MAVSDSGNPSLRASLVRSRLALATASAAVDAVMCLYFASVWLAVAAAAAIEIGRVACGAGPCCRAVAAASKVNDAAILSFALVSPVAMLLLIIRVANSPREKEEKVSAPETETETKTETDTETETKTETDTETESMAEVFAEAIREMWRNTLIRGVLVFGAFMELKLLVDLGGSLVKGSHWERICSVVRLVGALGADAMYCFVVIPSIAQRWMKKQPLM